VLEEHLQLGRITAKNPLMPGRKPAPGCEQVPENEPYEI